MPFMDHFLEEVVVKRKNTINRILYYLSWIIMILAANIIVPFMPYLLAFAAGAMMYVVVEELIPESSKSKHSNIGVIMFVAGCTIMMALDVALG